MRFREHEITVHGHRFRVPYAKGDGTGPVTVLLHGLARSPYMWIPPLLPFGSDNGASYIAPPLPGHYPATFPVGYDHTHLTPESLAGTLAKVIRRVVGDRETVLYGISLGAFTAMTLAALSDLPVRALVVISGFTHGAFGGIKGLGQYLARRGSTLARSFFRFSHRMLLLPGMVRWTMRFTANPAALYRYPHLGDLVDGVYAPLRHLDIEAMLVWYAALARMDLSSRLSQIEAQTLVIAGREDPLVSSDESVRIAEYIPNAELCLIEGVGHVPFLEAPADFGTALRRWANRLALN